MALTLYASPISQPSRSVTILLKAAEVDFEYKTIDLRAGEQKSAAFLEINPKGFVPAVKHDDFVLTEGAAILLYLSEALNLSHWYASDIHVRARINEWLHWAHTRYRYINWFIS
jgi:glutathione S-transferase